MKRFPLSGSMIVTGAACKIEDAERIKGVAVHPRDILIFAVHPHDVGLADRKHFPGCV